MRGDDTARPSSPVGAPRTSTQPQAATTQAPASAAGQTRASQAGCMAAATSSICACVGVSFCSTRQERMAGFCSLPPTAVRYSTSPVDWDREVLPVRTRVWVVLW